MAELLDALATLVRTRPTAAAFSDGSCALDWAEFAGRVGGWTARLAGSAGPVALLAENSVDWAAFDLACQFAGVTFVPLPGFFSDHQLHGIVAASGALRLFCDRRNTERALRLAVPAEPAEGTAPAALPTASARGARLIFNSGSTGAPKGVLLSERQMHASATAIASATRAGPADRHLSLLPLPLLLEQITAVHIPVLAGLASRLDPIPFPAVGGRDIVDRVERHLPSTMALVPELLSGWLAALRSAATRAPATLRFVAVGGAPVSPALAQQAWEYGIPVHEGYGLSECCSVVAVNRPGARRAGTVGRPLDGLAVSIEDGEIVVRGPTVMDGYLGDMPSTGVFRTGDLGAFDADGYLSVFGRRDEVIVTRLGRNVSPEWVEAAVLASADVAFCAVVGLGEARPAAIISALPGVPDDRALASARDAVEVLPPYARPGRMMAVRPEVLRSELLVSPNGRPNCRRMAAWMADVLGEPVDLPATAPKGSA